MGIGLPISSNIDSIKAARLKLSASYRNGAACCWEGAAAMSREIAFIDSIIPDFEKFLLGIRLGIEAISLSPQRPASAQIAEALRGRTGLDAIHVVAHGKPGEIGFGSGPL